MSKYNKGKIYMIINKSESNWKIYIGSTCDELRKRLWKHKTQVRNNPQSALHKYFAEVGVDNMNIILIKNYSCSKKVDLILEEKKIIQKYRPELNVRSPITFLYEKIQTYKCECGRIIQVREKPRHSRTIIHNIHTKFNHFKLSKYFKNWRNKYFNSKVLKKNVC